MNPANDALIQAIKQALERDPQSGPLWTHYAELLLQSGKGGDSLAACQSAVDLGSSSLTVLRNFIRLLRENGRLAEALVRAEKMLETYDDAALRLELARVLKDRGDEAGAAEQYRRSRAKDANLHDDALENLVATKQSTGLDSKTLAAKGESSAGDERLEMASVTPESTSPDDWVSQFEAEDMFVKFSEVAGLEDVKRQINLRIIAPFKNKSIYEAFGRQGGGGILLYGPPGCGKTYVARATAGECGARFVAVGIHDVIDKYWGESEKLIHALFDNARHRAPTVLFFDEFDALGSSRGRSESQFWKTLVDQLLQEMDGVGGKNEDVLIFAATNLPWSVDSAFRRPGRFDRMLFVPPPDETARAAILKRHVAKLPGGAAVNAEKLAAQTALMTGADLKSLCERASERALSRSLETNTVHPVTADDFTQELKKMQSSAGEWLATARNYAKYSNDAGQFDELADYLKKVKRW